MHSNKKYVCSMFIDYQNFQKIKGIDDKSIIYVSVKI